MIDHTNKLYAAALQAEPLAAARMIQRALGLDEDSPAIDHMPDRRTWMRANTTCRMFMIAQWLNAECRQVADYIENPANYVTVSDPMDTVGTRD